MVAAGARIGPPSVTLWLLACLLFFIPLAAVVCELLQPRFRTGRRVLWVGSVRHGSWIHLAAVPVGEQPVLLSIAPVFCAANALAVFGTPEQWLTDSRAYAFAFVLAGIWLAAGINVIACGWEMAAEHRHAGV